MDERSAGQAATILSQKIVTARPTVELVSLDMLPETDTIVGVVAHREYAQIMPSHLADLMKLGRIFVYYLLYILLKRGWAKAQSFSQNESKLRSAYGLTPSSLHGRLRLTRSFFSAREREYGQLKSRVSILRKKLAQDDAITRMSRQASFVESAALPRTLPKL